MLLLRLLVSVCRSSGALVGLGALRFRRRRRRGREPRLRVEIMLVEQQLPERVVEEPAVACVEIKFRAPHDAIPVTHSLISTRVGAVVAAVRVLELSRVLDDLADIRPA